MKKVKWSCDDYLIDDGDGYFLLKNLQWKVRPTIAFIYGTMNVLACRDHDGGGAYIMIHACRWKHRLPSDQHDQTSPVVNKTRTVKKGKVSLYDT